ncbi:hypothetical protein BGZ94_000925, partial [Podila epigama]
MSSVATFHSSSSTSSLSTPKTVPLTELAETGQIVLSAKPRLINVTHQIPYACTLIDRHTASASAHPHAVASSSATSSPPNRRSSHIAPRQQSASSNGQQATGSEGSNAAKSQSSEPLHLDGDCRLDHRRGHSALYSGIMSLRNDLETIQIGWVGELADQDGYVVPTKNLTETHKTSLKDMLWTKDKVVPIFLDDSRAAGHYEGYCKTG